MTTETLVIATVENGNIEAFNIRICYIKRIIEQRTFIGATTNMAKWDDICDMNNIELEEYDQHLHELCTQLSHYTHE